MAAVMLLAGLAACTPFGSGPDRDEQAIAVVERSVESVVPEANGVFVTMAFSGPSDRSMSVRLYIDPVDDAALADAVDRAAREAWETSPIALVELALEAVAGDRPAAPPRGVEQVTDLRVVADALGIDARYVVDGRLALPETTLVRLYGPAGADVE
ncbi:hypothetical protein OVN20_12595 [Microcella daejeonensis]|uniref:hypothetical protein n=1 Tax=Microcella daejeonensis TaxID=2994971 RepID=UPI00226E4962|nr:hypothetical protein [Microcella daejeonensis]WAB83851.1 hypothetical protein OVN20_12595 [Microcella daejeonensis]